MKAELLKLLNPKTSRLDGAGGGRPTLTSDDINAACAGANELGLQMLLARVCDDRQAQNKAFYRLYSDIVDLSIVNKWKIRERGEEKIRGLVQLIIFELTSTPRCPKCKGTKYNRALKQCKPCEGTGFYKIRNSHRAKALKINQSTWNRVWEFRYSEALSLVLNCESEALRKISKNLSGT